MRSIKKMGSVVGLVVAVVALTGAASASATPLITPAGTAFSGTSSGEHVFTINSNLKVRCDHATFSGTTSNPASDTTLFTPAYGDMAAAGKWCRLYVGGVFTAGTVTPTGQWSLKVTSLSGVTSSGHVTTSGVTHITVGPCTIDVPSGTVVPVTGTNVASPTGVHLVASGTGLSYTSSGCSGFGVPASGTTATYSGTVDIPGLTVS